MSTFHLTRGLDLAVPSASAMLRPPGATGLLPASRSSGIALSEPGEHHSWDMARPLIKTLLVQAAG